MKFRPIFVTLAFSMADFASAHACAAETVTKNFDMAIPSIPGQSLIAEEIDYALGAAPPCHNRIWPAGATLSAPVAAANIAGMSGVRIA